MCWDCSRVGSSPRGSSPNAATHSATPLLQKWLSCGITSRRPKKGLRTGRRSWNQDLLAPRPTSLLAGRSNAADGTHASVRRGPPAWSTRAHHLPSVMPRPPLVSIHPIPRGQRGKVTSLALSPTDFRTKKDVDRTDHTNVFVRSPNRLITGLLLLLLNPLFPGFLFLEWAYENGCISVYGYGVPIYGKRILVLRTSSRAWFHIAGGIYNSCG